MPGLHQVAEVDGFITSNLKTIYIEEKLISADKPFRYYFTLAHEIGHLILHKYIYKQAPFNNIEEYREFRKNFTANQQRRIEMQANIFAGLVLIPQEHIVKDYNEALNSISGIKIKFDRDKLNSAIAGNLHTKYCVSKEAMKIRLDIMNRY